MGLTPNFGLGRFLAEALTGAFGSLVFKYYETEIGMAGWIVALAGLPVWTRLARRLEDNQKPLAAFAVVHALTGFAAAPRSPAAILGIRLHQAGIPAALLLIGFVVFRALNTLTPEVARENRRVLREKGW